MHMEMFITSVKIKKGFIYIWPKMQFFYWISSFAAEYRNRFKYIFFNFGASRQWQQGLADYVWSDAIFWIKIRCIVIDLIVLPLYKINDNSDFPD